MLELNDEIIIQSEKGSQLPWAVISREGSYFLTLVNESFTNAKTLELLISKNIPIIIIVKILKNTNLAKILFDLYVSFVFENYWTKNQAAVTFNLGDISSLLDSITSETEKIFSKIYEIEKMKPSHKVIIFKIVDYFKIADADIALQLTSLLRESLNSGYMDSLPDADDKTIEELIIKDFESLQINDEIIPLKPITFDMINFFIKGSKQSTFSSFYNDNYDSFVTELLSIPDPVKESGYDPITGFLKILPTAYEQLKACYQLAFSFQHLSLMSSQIKEEVFSIPKDKLLPFLLLKYPTFMEFQTFLIIKENLLKIPEESDLLTDVSSEFFFFFGKFLEKALALRNFIKEGNASQDSFIELMNYLVIKDKIFEDSIKVNSKDSKIKEKNKTFKNIEFLPSFNAESKGMLYIMLVLVLIFKARTSKELLTLANLLVDLQDAHSFDSVIKTINHWDPDIPLQWQLILNS